MTKHVFLVFSPNIASFPSGIDRSINLKCDYISTCSSSSLSSILIAICWLAVFNIIVCSLIQVCYTYKWSASKCIDTFNCLLFFLWMLSDNRMYNIYLLYLFVCCRNRMTKTKKNRDFKAFNHAGCYQHENKNVLFGFFFVDIHSVFSFHYFNMPPIVC